MNALHFAEQDAQLGRLVRVHGAAKPRWMWVALAAVILLYVLHGAILQFDAMRVLLGLAFAIGTALVSVLRIPKRVGIYELGMVIHSPLFFSVRTVLWRDVTHVNLVKNHSSLSVSVDIELRDRTVIYLGSGIEDVEGIANAASYQRTTSTPHVSSPWG